MTDINNLQLREPDPIDWGNYDTGESKPIYLPPKGVYLLQVAEAPEAAGTSEGYLLMKFPLFKIIKPGDPADGAEIRFTNLSVKKWVKREGSPLGDFLKAIGIEGQRTNAEYIAAAQATVGRTFEASVDWKAYCSPSKGGCGLEIKKMENFPVGADGVRQPWVDCPKCKDRTDPNAPRAKRIWANAQIGFFKIRR